MHLNELRYHTQDPENRYGFRAIEDASNTPDTTGLSTQWEATPASEKVATVNRLVSADHSLSTAWQTLKSAIDLSNPALAAAYHKLDAGLEDVSSTAHSLAKTKYFNYQHGTGAITADRFFDVVELAERVLLLLPISDVLATMQVNKRLSATISSSKKLQQHLHLIPDHAAELRSLDFHPRLKCSSSGGWKAHASHLPNLNIKIHEYYRSKLYDRHTRRPTVTIELKKSEYSNPFKPFGRRIRKMLVSQPPVTEMDLKVSCCGASSVTVAYGRKYRCGGVGYDSDNDDDTPKYPARRQEQAEFAKVRNESGITLKDLYDTCWDVAEGHHLCPGAGEELMDWDGLNWPTLRFEGIVSEGCKVPEREDRRWEDSQVDKPAMVTPESPVEAYEARGMGYEVRDDEGRYMGCLLREYAHAKQAADYSGLPIPTLKEFVAYPSFRDWEVGVGLRSESESGHKYQDEGRGGWSDDDYEYEDVVAYLDRA